VTFVIGVDRKIEKVLEKIAPAEHATQVLDGLK
jgi:hypothetical protein